MKSFGKSGKSGKFGTKRFSKSGPRGQREGGFSRPGRRDDASHDRASRSGSGPDNAANHRDGGFKKELFTAVCGNCGGEAIVPFKPYPHKQVLCKACFEKNDDFEKGKDRFDRRPRMPGRFDSRSRDGASSVTLDMINKKLDKIMRALEIED